jgi:hypothetical protein
MSSDPNSLAGMWKVVQQPDNLFPISVNIQVSPDDIRVFIDTPPGSIEADNVVFAGGVLNCSFTIGDSYYPTQVKMRSDGNIDVTIGMGSGQIAPSVCSRVVDGN